MILRSDINGEFVLTRMIRIIGKESNLKNRSLRILGAIVTVLTLFSCGEGQHYQGVSTETNGIIIGEVDWREVTTLPTLSPLRINSNAVGEVIIPKRGRCTGFLINRNTLMTNHHCVPHARFAAKIVVAFRNLDGIPRKEHRFVKCNQFIMNHKRLDFALLRCPDNPGDLYGFVSLFNRDVKVDEPVYVIQQNCDYYTDPNCRWTKKYSAGKIKRRRPVYVHTADTLGGSSGSPVFSANSNTVVALHNAGDAKFKNGRGLENYAIPMRFIVSAIKKKLPALDIYLAD